MDDSDDDYWNQYGDDNAPPPSYTAAPMRDRLPSFERHTSDPGGGTRVADEELPDFERSVSCPDAPLVGASLAAASSAVGVAEADLSAAEPMRDRHKSDPGGGSRVADEELPDFERSVSCPDAPRAIRPWPPISRAARARSTKVADPCGAPRHEDTNKPDSSEQAWFVPAHKDRTLALSNHPLWLRRGCSANVPLLLLTATLPFEDNFVRQVSFEDAVGDHVSFERYVSCMSGQTDESEEALAPFERFETCADSYWDADTWDPDQRVYVGATLGHRNHVSAVEDEEGEAGQRQANPDLQDPRSPQVIRRDLADRTLGAPPGAVDKSEVHEFAPFARGVTAPAVAEEGSDSDSDGYWGAEAWDPDKRVYVGAAEGFGNHFTAFNRHQTV